MNDKEFQIENSQETLFECDICEKKLLRSRSLRYHYKNVHCSKKDYDYECDICGNSFTQFRHLQTHIKTVHGHKNLKCNSCEKLFSVSSKLRRHFNTVHEGQRDHKCDTVENLLIKAKS